MTDKKDKYRLKVGISVDLPIKDMSDVLRDRYNINISSLCRNAIVSEYDRMMDNEKWMLARKTDTEKTPTGGDSHE